MTSRDPNPPSGPPGVFDTGSTTSPTRVSGVGPGAAGGPSVTYTPAAASGSFVTITGTPSAPTMSASASCGPSG